MTLCAVLIGFAASAQPNSKLRPNETVLLYGTELKECSDVVVGKVIKSAGFKMETESGISGPEREWGGGGGGIANVSSNARVDLYFPKKPNGQMVVVCPGGAYAFVSSYNEGLDVAEWMTQKGITVAVVKYRMPNGHWEIPLTDVQNAFRYCRSHAAEWGVNQIGIIGFSAGGHLAASASNLFVDDVTRPDFSILIYPVITMTDGITHAMTKSLLLGNADKWNDKSKSVKQWEEDMARYHSLVQKYSIEKQVKENTPVTFIAHSTDDTTVPVENVLMYYTSLINNKVPVEMHLYPKGEHGWGFSSVKRGEDDRLDYCRDEFDSSLERWLESLR